MKRTLVSGVGVATLLRLTDPGTAADLPVVMPVKATPVSNVYNWTGFYLRPSRLRVGRLGLERELARGTHTQHL